MKKVIKISLVAIVALFLFLNVGLNLNGNKAEGLIVTTGVKTAGASSDCAYDPQYAYCFCGIYGYYCGYLACDLTVRCAWE